MILYKQALLRYIPAICAQIYFERFSDKERNRKKVLRRFGREKGTEKSRNGWLEEGNLDGRTEIKGMMVGEKKERKTRGMGIKEGRRQWKGSDSERAPDILK